jgi:hypothetical protein
MAALARGYFLRSYGRDVVARQYDAMFGLPESEAPTAATLTVERSQVDRSAVDRPTADH